MSLADRPTGYTAARVVKTAEDIAIREEIVSMMNGRFVIPAEEVSELIKRRNVSIDAILTHLIQPASALARPPISKYHVGAAGVAGSGTIYIGVNLELLHSPLNHSIHAEQFLAVNLVKAREERLVTLAVSAAPCGHCRQFFAELAYAGEVRFLFGDQAPLEARTLDDLLPLRFGPQDLIGPDGSLLLQPQHHDIKLTLAAKKWIEDVNVSSPKLSRAANQAIMEASRAYCPYTLCPAGVSIVLGNGDVFSGGCIESAAYNPTLTPFHTAYIAACIGGMKSLEDIREVVLVERRGAKVKYSSTIKLILKSVASMSTLTTLLFK